MANKNIIIGIAVILAIIIIGPKLGLGMFSVGMTIPNTDLKVSYQEMVSGCVVRLEKNSSTTWVGVYNTATNGKTNADSALSIGWVDSSSYQDLVDLLKNHPPTESCILSNLCNIGEKRCVKREYQECISGSWHLISPQGCLAYYNPLDNCEGNYLYPSQKTSNDYTNLGECLSTISPSTLGKNNLIGDFVCPCITGQESCANFNYFVCENSKWVNKGVLVGKCGKDCNGLGGRLYEMCMYGTDTDTGLSNYVTPNKNCEEYQNTNTNTETSGLDNVLFQIGTFNVTLLILLIVGGVIVVLFLLIK